MFISRFVNDFTGNQSSWSPCSYNLEQQAAQEHAACTIIDFWNHDLSFYLENCPLGLRSLTKPSLHCVIMIRLN